VTPLIDINELKLGDGWMRATSPSGRAAFEGVEAWSPSARMGGLAAAEPGQGSAQSPVVGPQPESSSVESEPSSSQSDAEAEVEEDPT